MDASRPAITNPKLHPTMVPTKNSNTAISPCRKCYTQPQLSEVPWKWACYRNCRDGRYLHQWCSMVDTLVLAFVACDDQPQASAKHWGPVTFV